MAVTTDTGPGHGDNYPGGSGSALAGGTVGGPGELGGGCEGGGGAGRGGSAGGSAGGSSTSPAATNVTRATAADLADGTLTVTWIYSS
jgi:hypothetical protein